MFSKKYYRAIADIIRDTETSFERNHTDDMSWEVLDKQDLIGRLVIFFSQDNPSFDGARFRKWIVEGHD